MKLSSIAVSVMMVLAFSSLSYGACKYKVNLEKSKISWVAFKTPKKVGVKVGFDKFSITPAKATGSKSIKDLVKNASFTIDVLSLNSANPERDTKLKDIFFTSANTPLLISGKVLTFKKNEIEVELKINETKKIIKMQTSLKDNIFEANGKIDVLDFALNENLRKINEACKVLHEEKTWSDVEIKIESEFDKKC